jgi:hypothetical protein
MIPKVFRRATVFAARLFAVTVALFAAGLFAVGLKLQALRPKSPVPSKPLFLGAQLDPSTRELFQRARQDCPPNLRIKVQHA